MLLVVDVGNTNMTFGLYNGEKLIGSYRLTTKLKRTSDEYGFMLMNFLNISKVLPEDIDDVIVASVVPKIMYSFNNSLQLSLVLALKQVLLLSMIILKKSEPIASLMQLGRTIVMAVMSWL